MDRVPFHLEHEDAVLLRQARSPGHVVRVRLRRNAEHDLLTASIEPGRGTFHPDARGRFPRTAAQPYQQDLDKAEDLLDEAGWTDSDGDGIRDKEINGRRVPFEFTLHDVSDRRPAFRLCTLMKECLDKIGIICNVKPTEFTVLDRLLNRSTSSKPRWAAGVPAPIPTTSTNIYGTGEDRNYGQYSNPRVDELFEQGRREFDREKRAAIYGEIHNILWEDQPYTWLFYRNAFYGFNKKLRGYNFSPARAVSVSARASTASMPRPRRRCLASAA